MSITRTVQTIVVNDGKILLGEWKKGPYTGRVTGPMAWVQYGLRSEAGMRKEAAACVEKLTAVKVKQAFMERRATLLFIEEDPYSLNVEHVYMFDVGVSPRNQIMESDSMIPFWAPLRKIPYARMPEDDALWLPLFLKKRSLQGQFVFNGTELRACKVKSVGKLFDLSRDHIMPFI